MAKYIIIEGFDLDYNVAWYVYKIEEGCERYICVSDKSAEDCENKLRQIIANPLKKIVKELEI